MKRLLCIIFYFAFTGHLYANCMPMQASFNMGYSGMMPPVRYINPVTVRPNYFNPVNRNPYYGGYRPTGPQFSFQNYSPGFRAMPNYQMRPMSYMPRPQAPCYPQMMNNYSFRGNMAMPMMGLGMGAAASIASMFASRGHGGHGRGQGYRRGRRDYYGDYRRHRRRRGPSRRRRRRRYYRGRVGGHVVFRDNEYVSDRPDTQAPTLGPSGGSGFNVWEEDSGNNTAPPPVTPGPVISVTPTAPDIFSPPVLEPVVVDEWDLEGEGYNEFREPAVSEPDPEQIPEPEPDFESDEDEEGVIDDDFTESSDVVTEPEQVAEPEPEQVAEPEPEQVAEPEPEVEVAITAPMEEGNRAPVVDEEPQCTADTPEEVAAALGCVTEQVAVATQPLKEPSSDCPPGESAPPPPEVALEIKEDSPALKGAKKLMATLYQSCAVLDRTLDRADIDELSSGEKRCYKKSDVKNKQYYVPTNGKCNKGDVTSTKHPGLYVHEVARKGRGDASKVKVREVTDVAAYIQHHPYLKDRPDNPKGPKCNKVKKQPVVFGYGSKLQVRGNRINPQRSQQGSYLCADKHPTGNSGISCYSKPVRAVDCSGAMSSALKAAGLRLEVAGKKNRDLSTGQLINEAVAVKDKRCLNSVRFSADKSIEPGDVISMRGHHTFMIGNMPKHPEPIGFDPLGIKRCRAMSDDPKKRVLNKKDIEFNILQSGSIKEIGFSQLKFNYKNGSSYMFNALYVLALEACAAPDDEGQNLGVLYNKAVKQIGELEKQKKFKGLNVGNLALLRKDGELPTQMPEAGRASTVKFAVMRHNSGDKDCRYAPGKEPKLLGEECIENCIEAKFKTEYK